MAIPASVLARLGSIAASGGGGVGDYESIATYSLVSGQNSITFSSIPQTFKHLQIRGIALGSSASDDVVCQLNGVTASNNYSWHELRGNGSAVSAHSGTSTSGFYAATNALTTSTPATFIMDILDYTSTNKNKTMRTLQGMDSNGGGTISLHSGLYYGTTNAVTSIKLYAASGGNLNQYSHFALYGIKG